MANTEYLEGLAPKPFTTEDISKVISINLLVNLPEFENLFVCEKLWLWLWFKLWL